jgi:hypothetical protein
LLLVARYWFFAVKPVTRNSLQVFKHALRRF